MLTCFYFLVRLLLKHCNRQAVGYHLRKEVMVMRITLHIGSFTITVIVKRNNRHLAE